MLKPINNHVLIEPVVHESFISSQRDTYEEIGVVIDFDEELGIVDVGTSVYRQPSKLYIGDKVYFDSWLAAKYPKNETEYYWLVKYEDIRAVEHALPQE